MGAEILREEHDAAHPESARGKLRGALSGPLGPYHLEEDWNGDFIDVRLPIVTLPVLGEEKRDQLKLKVGSKPGQNKMSMKLDKDDPLLVARFHGVVPDWKFQ